MSEGGDEVSPKVSLRKISFDLILRGVDDTGKVFHPLPCWCSLLDQVTVRLECRELGRVLIEQCLNLQRLGEGTRTTRVNKKT
jgi:hypothetical protein